MNQPFLNRNYRGLHFALSIIGMLLFRFAARSGMATAADRSVRSTLFQFVLEVVFDHVEEMIAIVGAADAVGFIGIDHEAELLACLD
jgi:hypothetical protein